MLEKLGLAALRKLDPELAHRLAIAGLRSNVLAMPNAVTSPRLATKVAGLSLPNPVGLAAGFDKNAEAVNQLTRSGLGFRRNWRSNTPPPSRKPKASPLSA